PARATHHLDLSHHLSPLHIYTLSLHDALPIFPNISASRLAFSTYTSRNIFESYSEFSISFVYAPKFGYDFTISSELLNWFSLRFRHAFVVCPMIVIFFDSHPL